MAIRNNITTMMTPPKSRFDFFVPENQVKTQKQSIEKEFNVRDYDDIRFLKVTEAASILGTTKNMIYEMVGIGLLKGTKFGSLKIAYTELVKFKSDYNGKNVDEIIRQMKKTHKLKEAS